MCEGKFRGVAFGARPDSASFQKTKIAVEGKVSVYDYEDYHKFLKDWCESRRRQRSTFSFQELANRAGFKARSFLRRVTIGETDLLHAAALRLAEAMGLPEEEEDFFLALVGYNNATDPWERDLYLKKMRKFPRHAQRKVLSAQEFELFGKWYVAAIWEVVTILPFGDDFRKLGKALVPAITPDEARHAIRVLLDLCLIEPSDDRYIQSQRVLHTREELVSQAIKSYQRETMELAIRALDTIPTDRRKMSTLTMGLDAARWESACRLTQEYRQKLIDLGSEVAPNDRVVQFNLQAFPISAIHNP